MHKHTDRKPYAFTDEVLGIFEMGHLVDAWCKQAIDRAFYAEDRYIVTVPKRVTTKIDDLTIIGEMDLFVIDMKSRVVHVVDFKSMGASQFSVQKKDASPKASNGMQVGCYLMSSMVKDFVDLGFEARGWIAYICKETMGVHICKVNKMYADMAYRYWADINDCINNNFIPQAGDVNVLTPTESWQCGYCNMHPPFNPSFFANKTAAKNARVALGMSNMDKCRSCTSDSLGVPCD